MIFFFASAGASSSYLTVSEVFPLEVRAIALAFFFSLGTALGGFIGPLLYGWLIEKQAKVYLFFGYLLGGLLMIFGGIVGKIFGVDAEMKMLEDVTSPLSGVKVH